MTLPADPAFSRRARSTGANAFSSDAQGELLGSSAVRRRATGWVEAPAPGQAGIKPLEVLQEVRLATLLVLVARRRRARRGAGAARAQAEDGQRWATTTTAGEAQGRQAAPRSRGAGPTRPIDVHDVKLKTGPKGVKKFHSQPASSYYTFKRKLKKPGKYQIVCTLHEEMKMTITVKK